MSPYAHTSICHLASLLNFDSVKPLLEENWRAHGERKVVLHDWDQETIGRLVEWLYTGDYDSPRPTKVVHSVVAVKVELRGAIGGQRVTPIASPAAENFLDSDIIHQATARDANNAPVVDTEDRPQPLTPLAQRAFEMFKKNFYESSSQVLYRWLRDCKHDPHELNFETTLLAHAKVYSLANYMLLEDLQALAFLHLESLFNWIDSRIIAKSPIVSDLVTLTKYVYANTKRPNIGEEPLRDLLTTLIAKNFGCFNDGGKGQVRRLMDGGGDFGTDVWEKVSRHVGALGKDLRESHENVASLETELSGYRKKRRIG